MVSHLFINCTNEKGENNMKLIYGTGNPAKLESMRRALVGLNHEIIGLNELTDAIPQAPEDGLTPLENARRKALFYYNYFKTPVFSCDSGLYFDNLPSELQPGVHVRNVNGKYLSDDEMIDYYCNLARQYGHLKGRYQNAICLVLDENHIYESMNDDLSGNYFLIADKPHQKRIKGFPLDSLSVHIPSGRYYYDMENDNVVEVEKGFYKFFEDILKHY
ncbi:MAG: Xanthosine triphosphate pyrophosphatase [Anaerocolumna sp.]|nr:Xanthosine triphosphate pyrophosphatase [Anaerocolumna sp.]